MAHARLAEADALLRAGKPDAALAPLNALLASAASTTADRRMGLLLRAQAHEDRRDLAAAIADLRAALAIDARDARTCNTLGILLADTGDATAAIASFERATAIDAKHARAWNNLGNALRGAGRLSEARTALAHAVAAQPDYALAWSNLGAVQRDLGDDAAADASLRRALALQPELRPALIALAASARSAGRVDEAAALYARAAPMVRSDVATWLQLAGTLAERDDLALAQRAYGEAATAQPQSLRAAFGAALTLPMVYPDVAAVRASRAAYARNLDAVDARLARLVEGRAPNEVIDDLRWSNFLLAYQGEDDRALQEKYAAIVARAIDTAAPDARALLPRTSTAGRRIRVGFASSFFSEGTVGMYFRSWIEGLDRTRFEVFVYHLRRGMNPLASALAESVDRFRTFEGPAGLPSRVAPVIRADALDVLVYPELGMDAPTFALAALRLAPVQCAGWGHPVTSGHATVDVWLSCAAMEPEDAPAHYRERLVLLPGIGTCYAQPAPPKPGTRAAFGLPPDRPLFLCPQSLFKIHPDNDALFARALAAAGDARLVIFEGRHPALTARYRARLDAALRAEGLAFDRCVVVLPQCSHPQYLELNTVCDAMLDTLRWSGGNTSLDALACGLPIVTLPGRYMRGRQSAGMLQLMGQDELIAGDADGYVAIAARLARDASWRQVRRERILAARPRIFSDPAPIAALGEALLSLASG